MWKRNEWGDHDPSLKNSARRFFVWFQGGFHVEKPLSTSKRRYKPSKGNANAIQRLGAI